MPSSVRHAIGSAEVVFHPQSGIELQLFIAKHKGA